MVSQRSAPSAALAATVVGGLAAGALDIASAFVLAETQGGSAFRVLLAIASGVLGRDAFAGGTATAVLGLALHFFITLVAAALYVGASWRLPALAREPWRYGALYGVAVWVFMHAIVLPLSAVPFRMPFSAGGVATQLAIHVVFVGWPIALAARRWAGVASAAAPAAVLAPR